MDETVNSEQREDGRTNIGKLQAKLKELEDAQKEIQKKLTDHEKRIISCGIRR